MMDLNLNVDLGLLRKHAALEIEGNGGDYASETSGDAELLSENGMPVARISGSKAWKHTGTLKITAR